MKKPNIKFNKETAAKVGKAGLDIGARIIIAGTQAVILEVAMGKLNSVSEKVKDKVKNATAVDGEVKRKKLFGRKEKEVVVTETVEVKVKAKVDDKAV